MAIEIIGLTLDEFKKNFPEARYRVVNFDGTPMMVTRNLVLDRYNLKVRDGKIIEYYFG